MRWEIMFSWDDLRYFAEVARAKSLSGAASKLGVSHTTVARRVQALEGSLKARLFEKTPTGYVPTPAGKQIILLAEQVESICISAMETVAGQDTVLTGAVRVAAPEGFGSQFIGKRLDRFYKEYSGIDLEIVTSTQFVSISKHDADIVITFSRPRAGRLVARKLTDYAFRLYGSREYLKQFRPIRHIEDLREHTLIGFVNDLISPQLNYFDELLPDARTKLRSSNINGQLSAVEAGLGLAVLPCYMATGLTGLDVVLPEEVAVTRSFWISMHENMRHIRRVMAVWDWIQEVVKEERALLM
jgi:DNA-binding transcriptional LysR family regulator